MRALRHRSEVTSGEPVASYPDSTDFFQTLSRAQQGLQRRQGLRALSPSTVQAAVHAGHQFAREFDGPIPNEVPYKLERIDLSEVLQ